MKVTQVQLFKLSPKSVGPVTKMTCWLRSDDYKLREGLILSLKDVEGIWSVEYIYTTQDHYEINRNWKVGGL